MPHLYPPEYWHRQADETRRLATMLSRASDKRITLAMAEAYDREATGAEERLRRQEAQAQLKLDRAAVTVLMRVADARRLAFKESIELVASSLAALRRADVLLSRMPFAKVNRADS